MKKEEILNNYYNEVVLPDLNFNFKRSIIDYEIVNKYILVKDTNDLFTKLQMESDISKIRQVIKYSKNPTDLVVYYQISEDLLKNSFNDKYIKPEIFLNTSLEPIAAINQKGILLEIHLPKNYPALWLKNITLQPNILLLNNTYLEIIEYDKLSKIGNINQEKIKVLAR